MVEQVTTTDAVDGDNRFTEVSFRGCIILFICAFIAIPEPLTAFVGGVLLSGGGLSLALAVALAVVGKSQIDRPLIQYPLYIAYSVPALLSITLGYHYFVLIVASAPIVFTVAVIVAFVATKVSAATS